MPLSIFRLPTLTGAITAGLLIGGSFFAFLFVGTLYMQQVLHYSSLQTGLADWYHNLNAQPNTRIEVGAETIDVVAEEATGEERERLFTQAAERYPQLAEIASKTHRVIPMIVLTPRGSA